MKNRALSFLLPLCLLTFLVACPSKKKEETAKPAAVPAPTAPTTPTAAKSIDVKSDFSTPVGATKTFYEAVVGEKYDLAWKSLTKTSQDKIIAMVAEEEKLDAAAVRKMFDNNETPIQMGFWKSFRASSRVTEYVPEAVYKMLSENGNEASVELANKLVVLDSKAFKEGGEWKMGYVESFMSDESPKPKPQ